LAYHVGVEYVLEVLVRRVEFSLVDDEKADIDQEVGVVSSN
jgi:hypothetical protein